MIDILLKLLEIIIPVEYIKEKISGVQLEIKLKDKRIVIKNKSKCSAYNFRCQASPELFWTYNKVAMDEFPPEGIVIINYSLIHGYGKGELCCTWTNKKGNKQKKYIYKISL